jgi:hypothetical protein
MNYVRSARDTLFRSDGAKPIGDELPFVDHSSTGGCSHWRLAAEEEAEADIASQ